MNSYITLDGYRYRTVAKQWKPKLIRPATVRVTLGGALDATFGPVSTYRWEGLIVSNYGSSAPVGPEGNSYTLRASLEKRNTLSFTDHLGATYTVGAQGPFDQSSLKNVWDAPDNKIYYYIVLTGRPA
jgi:hypothetical protein